MIAPPSKPLLDTLLELKLCTPGDLRRCRARVKRLTYDLPVFDSVWIDALLQARKLTPFQAKLLESGDSQQLCVGPCVLVDQLGEGRAASSYLARRRDGNERCVLKLMKRPAESLSSSLSRLQEFVTRLKNFSHPAIVVPHSCLAQHDQIVAISRFVPGPHLGELVVRRGRLPAPVVAEIARKLLDGLAALEAENCVHGAIHLTNVRLTSGGVAVLVDAGVAPVIAPETVVYAGLSPERCDGVAPELIGTGRPSSSASDLYALGCLLWHLLAGRPPFTTADPLAKLASHQTRRIEDVREIAPDTPPFLAEFIHECTAPDVDARPDSFRAASEQLGLPRRSGRRRLSRFRATFNTGVPRIPVAASTVSPGRWSLLFALLFVATGAVLTLQDQGGRGQLLQISRLLEKISGSEPTSPGNDATDNETTAGGSVGGHSPHSDEKARQSSRQHLIPMPSPNAEDVILLTSAGPYEAAEISKSGPLIIRGTAEQPAEIIIDEQPLQVWAEQLLIENVRLRRADVSARQAQNPADSAERLLVVESQDLRVRNCSFQTGHIDNIAALPEGEPKEFPQAASIDWKLIDKQDRSGGHVELRDTVFSGHNSAVTFRSVPSDIQIDNCLKLGSGALLTFSEAPQAGRMLPIRMQRTTLRAADALIRLVLSGDQERSGGVTLESVNCVMDVTGDRAALFQLVASRSPKQWLESIEFIGEGSLIPPEYVIASWINSNSGEVTVLDEDEQWESEILRLEGVFAVPFEFVGPMSPDIGNSMLKTHQAPQQSDHLPGFDVTQLPISKD